MQAPRISASAKHQVSDVMPRNCPFILGRVDDFTPTLYSSSCCTAGRKRSEALAEIRLGKGL